jgi:Leucine-rich repeat (LRR) protein
MLLTQRKAILSIFLSFAIFSSYRGNSQVGPPCDRQSDSLELVKLYEATQGPNWRDKWNLELNMDSWFGIGLNEEGCVVSIDFSLNGGNQLNGTLPSLRLPALKILRLSDNQLMGALPDFSFMENLEVFNISNNRFTGTGEPLRNLKNLQRLNLQGNQLEGTLSWLVDINQLRFLNLSKNNFRGSLLPLENMPQMVMCDVSGNLFTGNLARMDLSFNMEQYNVSYNLLTGIIPAFYSMSKLEILTLNNNGFTGFEQDFFFTLPSLQQLYLQNNAFVQVPSALDQIPNLAFLNLSGNQLTSLPNFNFPIELNTLDLRFNRLKFNHIVPNLNKASTTRYIPQSSISDPKTLEAYVGDPVNIEVLEIQDFPGNVYNWYKEGEFLFNSLFPSLFISPVSQINQGNYVLEITHPLAPGLVLRSGEIQLNTPNQSANDACLDATEIYDLYGGCYDYSLKNVSLDVAPPSCFMMNPFNVWFSFTARTSMISIQTSEGQGRLDVSLLRFASAPCSSQGLVELDCKSGSLTFSGLVPGVRYYIMVSKGSYTGEQFSMCVNNFVPFPSNDNRCSATNLSVPGCVDGLLYGARPDFVNASCQEYNQATVWYRFFMPPGTSVLQVDFRNNTLKGPLNVVVFNDRDCSLPPIVNGVNSYCGLSDKLLYFDNVTGGQFYYLMVGSSFESAGNFTLCLNGFNFSEEECLANLSCAEASKVENILNLNADNPKICLQNCNFLGQPGITTVSQQSCLFTPEYTKWYRIKADEDANVLSVELETEDEVSQPKILLVNSNFCTNFTLIQCIDTALVEGKLQFQYNIEPGQDFLLLVSSDQPVTADFNICLRVFSRPNRCAIQTNLSSVRTSLLSNSFGPFLPGEEVEFCYEITEWVKYDCSKLQGIVPIFGSGWDPASFEPKGAPQLINQNLPSYKPGAWFWKENNEVTYKTTAPFNTDYVIFPGQRLRAGWFFQEYDPETDGYLPVAESLGDGGNCLQDSLTWRVCFTLKTKDFGDCEALSGSAAKIDVLTFSDAEIGANTGGGCYTDVRTSFAANISCCLGDVLPDTLSFTICDNERFNLHLPSQLGLDREFRWIPIENSSVRGARAGKGRTFSGTFTIFQQDNSQKQYFQLYSINALGCRSNFAILELDIKFNPYVQFSAQGQYCEGDTVSILLEGFLSEVPLQVEYQYDGQTGILTLDENNQFVFKALAEKVNTFDVASIFNDFCSSNESIDRVFITLHPKKSTSLFYNQCKGSPVSVNGKNYLFPGIFYDTLSTTRGCDSLLIIEIALDSFVLGNHYFIELCHGETFTLFSKEYSSTGVYTDTVSIKGSCDSIHTLDVRIYDPIALSGSVIINDSGQGDGAISLDVGGGKPPYSFHWSHGRSGSFVSNLAAGAYRVTVTDDLGCTAFFGFEVMQATHLWPTSPFSSLLDLYPNPVRRGETLFFAFEQPLSAPPKVAVLTAQGQIWGSFRLSPGLSPFAWEWTTPVHLPAGWYGLLISSEKGETWFKNCVIK